MIPRFSKQRLDDTSRKISWGHWFVFFNTLCLFLIGSRYAFLIDWPNTLLGKVYFFLSTLGHFSFIAFGFYLLILFPLSFFLHHERAYRGISVILATSAISLILVDTEVFSNFHIHLSTLVWNLLTNPEDGELARQWQLFFAPMPFILLLQMVYSRWSWQKLRSLERQRWLKWVGVFYLSCFVSSHFLFAWADATDYRPITMQKSNLPFSYPMTARSFLQRHQLLLENLHLPQLQLNKDQGEKLHYPKAPLDFKKVNQKQNLFFVHIKGWKTWQKEEPLSEMMPKLSILLPQGKIFTQHYAASNETTRNDFGLWYGLPPRFYAYIQQQNTPPLWINALQKQGYQLCLDIKAQPWLTQKNACPDNRKNFTFFDEKTPWTYVAETEIFDENREAQLKALDNEIFEQLSTIDLKNTLVILVGSPAYERGTLPIQQEYMGSPLVIFSPKLKVSTNKLTSHLDLVPTLMKELLQVKNPIHHFAQGNNLFSKEKPTWVQWGNQYWRAILNDDNETFLLNTKGDYQKINTLGDRIPSARPPLGLFLEVFSQDKGFWGH